MKSKKFISVLLSFLLILTAIPVTIGAETSGAVLTFTDSAIEETAAGSGYAITGTDLSITAAGVYTVTGSCSEGSIAVSKGLSGVTLILDNLNLASSTTAPVVIKKTTSVEIHLSGTSTLTNNENPANETSSDATVADAFEGAAVKVKSDSSIVFCGDGNLNIVANAKNGIKGGSCASIIFNQSGTISVSGSGKYYGQTTAGAALNNGIGCDGSLVFNQGSFVIKAANDGIKSSPDATDAAEGTTIDTASAGTVTINGGTFDIDVDGDGITADTNLTINGGTFDISTWKGYSTWSDSLSNLYSCKGLKASGDRAEEAELEPTILITGGTFTMNVGDDAVHSDANCTITGGTFQIQTGDDGVHADTLLILGTEGSQMRNPDITISNSYEGLESGTLKIYSGRYIVHASDDGVNAAGGSSNGSDPWAGNDPFRPGRPGTSSGTTTSGSYNLYIYGGDLYVDCQGDGLDSNGGLYLYGGTQVVFSMQANGDNSAIDSDGTVLIDGATVFTAGAAGMDGSAKSSWFGSSQKYSASSTSYNAGTIITTKAGSGGETVFSYSLPRRVNYVMASWPTSLSSSAPVMASASAVTPCSGGSICHSWDNGVVTTAATAESTGVMTYTCTLCGETETHSIPKLVAVAPCTHFEQQEVTDQGYGITFAGDEGVASITVYKMQDYAGESESIPANGTAVSRNSDTGEADSTGSGQVNFTVVLADGYSISSVTATSGTYKNIKGPDETGLANTYRITKITGDSTITITTVQCPHGTIAQNTTPVWTWSDDFGSASLSYVCADCGQNVSVSAAVSSQLSDANTITFQAKAEIDGQTFTDTKTAAPFTGTFSSEHASILVFNTQNYAAPDQSDAKTAVARDSASGNPVITGDGQINFAIVPEEGYEVEDVTIEGPYKNLKDISADAGLANCYRITKITGNLVITITCKEADTTCQHDFSAQIQNASTLKSAGTCCQEALYYYSCKLCGACERNDEHLFAGEKDANNHCGETERVNVQEATCAKEGYTGDLICKDCQTVLEKGSVTAPTEEHCGGHATCLEKAVCNVCGQEYGDYGSHTLSHHEALKPDYDHDGNIEYWTCDVCGKYFSDENAQNEITQEDTILARLVGEEYEFLDGDVIIQTPADFVPDGWKFDVQKIVPMPQEIEDMTREQLGAQSIPYVYYQIRLIDPDGNEVTDLGDEITIKLKMPEEYAGKRNVRYLQEDEDGKLVNMNAWWDDSYLCFYTDWLEKYND